MSIPKTLLILLITLNAINSKIAQWEEISKQDGFFSKLLDQDFVVVLSNTNKNQEKILRDLENLENNSFIKENKVDLLFINNDKTEFFKRHYDLTNDTNLYFFIRNQLFVFENFENDFSKNNILELVSEFIERNILSISIQLKNLAQVENLLANKKIIGIYLGSKNANYESFYKLSLHNRDFNFYFSSSQELKNQIYKNYSLEDTPEKDTFTILRHPSEITDFDSEQLVSFKNFSSQFEINQFFKFERYPKLRDCSFNAQNVDNLYLKREKMLLYVTNEKEKNEKNDEVFFKTLKLLPKRLIYSKCDLESEMMNNYYSVFMRGGYVMESGKLYIVYISLAKRVDVLVFNQEFTEKNVSNFVFDFYSRHRSEFEEVREEKEFREEEI